MLTKYCADLFLESVCFLELLGKLFILAVKVLALLVERLFLSNDSVLLAGYLRAVLFKFSFSLVLFLKDLFLGFQYCCLFASFSFFAIW